MDGCTCGRQEKSGIVHRHRIHPETAKKEVKEMAKPLLDILCTKGEPYCPYPIEMKVTMDDGSVQTYVLQNKTEFQFRAVMDSLDRMCGYHPPHIKRRRHRSWRCDTVR